MESAPRHATALELEQSLDEVLASPKDSGPLQAIFLRPRPNERQAVQIAELSPAAGIVGDRWAFDHWQTLDDGSSDPQSQVSLMNVRILQRIAGSPDAMCLAGDNLILDLDLSEANLPAGSRIRIGNSVVLEFTGESHTGCGKFERRYGRNARAFVNGTIGSRHNLRGRMARVRESGKIAVGDLAKKI